MAKHGKRYRQVAGLIDSNKTYEPEEAVEAIGKMASTKFDETVEVHLRTGADVRHSDQQVRGVTVLPHGLGKTQRVLVFASGEAAEGARQAGADYVGVDDLIKKIEGGWLEFDVGLAVPEIMAKIGKLGKILGRRGLMPNPRTGTLVQAKDLPRTIDEVKKGRLEYRTDRTAIIHCPVGKASFSKAQILANLTALIDAIMHSKPEGIKGTFIRKAYLTTTMGPSVELELGSLLALKVV
jgi:large subunit ribosomal protein L1